MTLQAPFTWFGGKMIVTDLVWPRLGPDVGNYVEPFFGSGSMLLGRPGWDGTQSWTETVNDRDGFISNFWRAMQHDPQQIAELAAWPVNENDLHARHVWLRERRDDLTRRLEGNPDYYDAKIAGWWVWGICCWIGSGWCDPDTTGPWVTVEDEDGYRQLLDSRTMTIDDAGRGVTRQLVHLRGSQGVKRQLVHLGNAGQGVTRQRVHLGWHPGVKRKRAHLGNGHNAGTGESGLLAWMQALSNRLARVRVASGGWERVCGPSPTFKLGTTAVFLDPPYAQTERDVGLYANESGAVGVAADVRQWCIENGDNPKLRIALCGYDTEHHELDDLGWLRVTWTAVGGYSNQGNAAGKDNRYRECIWFSPHCLTVENHHQMEMFA